MNLRKFGPTSLTVSRLCLGTSNFARYANQEASFSILDAFREAGGNFFQTSGICPGINLGDGCLGLPEEVLGRWLRQREIRRDEIVIATRVALTRPIIGRVDTFVRLIRQCAEDSIRRIGCGYLDLLVVECTDAIAPISETMPALQAVAGTEKVRHVVPANFPAWLLRDVLRHPRCDPGVIAGVQVDYSLLARDGFEGGVAEECARLKLGVIGRSPLARGYLAEPSPAPSLDPLRDLKRDSWLSRAAERVWPGLARTARAMGRPPAQLAVAWVLSHPQIDSVLVSVRSVDQLHELMGGVAITLTHGESAELATITTVQDGCRE